MNIQQAVKMAWKSIWGKKGRSALTILGIFIGIAAVMTIVSVMEGMKQKTMEQFEAMGSNRITVSIYSWMYDEDGNDISRDYFPDLYDYCTGLSEYVLGITPAGFAILAAATAILFTVSLLQERGVSIRSAVLSRPLPQRWLLLYALLIFTILFYVPNALTGFIYAAF